MKIRGLLIMLAILLGLSAFVYFYEIEGGKKRAEEEKTQKKLLSVEEAKMQEIGIFHGAEQIRARREGTLWKITVPLETEADQYEWNSIARGFQDMTKDKELEVPASELKGFGLETPRVRVEIKTSDGKQQEVWFGDDNPTQSFVYSKLPEKPSVYLVASYSFRLADKKLFDLRDKSVFKFEQSEVQELTLRNPEGTIVLKKKGDGWELDSPVQAAADKTEVDSLLSSINGGTAKEVLDQVESGAKTGLDQPTYELRVITGKDRAMKHLVVGAMKTPAPPAAKPAAEPAKEIPSDATFYARDDSRKPILVVDKYFVDKLGKKAGDLRDKSIAKLDRSKLKQLQITFDGENITLVKEGEDWLTSDKAKKAKSEMMSTLLSGIEFGKAIRLIDPPYDESGFGFDKPDPKIVLEQEGLGRQELILGRDADGGAYSRLVGEKTVKVVEKDLRGKLKLKAADLLVDNQPQPNR